jgi:hypothetical protein
MSEGRRLWRLPWWIPLLSGLFAGVWPVLWPGGNDLPSWAPLIAAAAMIWLGWAIKSWFLALLTGLIIVNHPKMDWSSYSSMAGWQLTSLFLLACWCCHFYELVWAGPGNRKGWLIWTLVGTLLAFSGMLGVGLSFFGEPTPRLAGQAASTLFLLWSATGLAVLVWWTSQRHQVGSWKCVLALLVPLVLSVAVIGGWALVDVALGKPDGANFPSQSVLPMTDTLKWLWSSWDRAMLKALPLLDRLNGVWMGTVLVVWGLWRSVRRARRCARQNTAASSVLLPLVFLAVLLQMALSAREIPASEAVLQETGRVIRPDAAGSLLLPLVMLTITYLVLDLAHGVAERMQLRPPTPETPGANTSQ